ncbi:hypothetical protein Pcinc_036621 [Petrolisthes cinctipes]|uniref:Uncharacterized protein n=1 Tax=Petrolisthes cinctipes TaxID=88211 RepID=A0AAE1BUM7_PETCI|nr:hypothetical protein Pcinc_036621 [Petrolisthes cinctipes]
MVDKPGTVLDNWHWHPSRQMALAPLASIGTGTHHVNWHWHPSRELTLAPITSNGTGTHRVNWHWHSPRPPAITRHESHCSLSLDSRAKYHELSHFVCVTGIVDSDMRDFILRNISPSMVV